MLAMLSILILSYLKAREKLMSFEKSEKKAAGMGDKWLDLPCFFCHAETFAAGTEKRTGLIWIFR